MSLRGHAAAERQILEGFNAGALHHAWLISGPRGIGKASLALRMAKFLLSQDPSPGLFGMALAPTSLDTDPNSAVCGQIMAGSHPDFICIPALNAEEIKPSISIEEVRKIVPFMRLTPSQGGWRVVVVDGIDKMTLNAQNAILKILEEPPEKAILILVTDVPGRLLPTIRSRCRKLSLERLTDEDVGALLESHAPELAGVHKDFVISYAQGSIGRALELVDPKALELYEELIGILSKIHQLDYAKLNGFCEKISGKQSTHYDMMIEVITHWLHLYVKEALKMGRASEGLMDHVDHIHMGFKNAQGFHLDKRQVLVNGFLEVKKIVQN